MRLNELFINMKLKKYKNCPDVKYIAIFGAGQNGLQLNQYLQQSGVTVDFFCDNNLQIQGTSIDGVPCISLDELCQYKKNVLVFVSPYKASEEIIEELKHNEFSHIISLRDGDGHNFRRELTDFEQSIYNDGERLIFGVSHGIEEDIRHRSSYLFFKKIIELDMQANSQSEVSIVDFGCGVGHGCETLAEIKNSRVLGVDISQESLLYASKHYGKENIQYKQVDLINFADNMEVFDYVVSRGVLEHIPDGLSVGVRSKWMKRLIFDVPYDENYGNPHHVIKGIREEDFAEFPNVEIFYQDLEGVIYNRSKKPLQPNVIFCVCSSKGLSSIETLIDFPVPAWKVNRK